MFKLSCFLVTLISVSGIYDYSVTDSNGTSLPLSQFQGKKVLFVNTASTSQYTSQYNSLEQLYQKYKDSLIVIAFPSNSFGHETGSNEEIRRFVLDNYDIHFLLSQKIGVTGANQDALYGWLTHISQNGVMETQIRDDFYKFLIDKSGNLVGAFAPSVDPMNEAVQNAIENR